MSGCHNPNNCYHVDGEFCDRCHTKVPAMSVRIDDGKSQKIFCNLCLHDLPCKCVWQAVRDCQQKIEKVELKSVDVTLIHTMRQTIETWQRACEVQVNNLNKNVADLEQRIEAVGRGKILLSSGQCNKITFEEIEKARKWLEENGNTIEEILNSGKKENPSRQHLEQCLHEKNLKIKDLEARLNYLFGLVNYSGLLKICCKDFPHVGECRNDDQTSNR